ncbi:MAG TPA: FecR domain-containing protein [Puia sp.]|nr:FecR domain-containing protein [Puia sp.]
MTADVPGLIELLRLWAESECTEAQMEELFASIREAGDPSLVEDALAQEWANQDAGEPMPWIGWDEMFARVLAVRPRRTISLRRKVLAFSWTRVAAVVVALAVLGGAGWLMIRPSSVRPAIVEAGGSGQDVLPGGNKAVLTLGNGQRIVLDSLAPGQIAVGSGITATKTDKGQLAYAASRGAAGGMVYNTLATPRGGQYQLVLPDGSKVWLNAASSITYPTAFAGAERKVTVSGEAYFEVARRPGQPFRVKTAGEEVEVLGTAFDLNAYSDEPRLETTLLEGAVRVVRDKQKVLLRPGEQAQAVQGMPIAIKKAVNTEQVLAWKNGLFNFDGADLKTVLRQLSRWYDVNIALEGEPVKRKFFGEMSRDLTLSQVLQGFGEMQLRFRIEGKKLILSK